MTMNSERVWAVEVMLGGSWHVTAGGLPYAEAVRHARRVLARGDAGRVSVAEYSNEEGSSALRREEIVTHADAVVREYATGKPFYGPASDELVARIEEAGPTGAVLAYRHDDGTWQYVRPDEADHLRALGERVVKVYVEVPR